MVSPYMMNAMREMARNGHCNQYTDEQVRNPRNPNEYEEALAKAPRGPDGELLQPIILGLRDQSIKDD